MTKYENICIVDDEPVFAEIQIDILRENKINVQYFDSIEYFMKEIRDKCIHKFDLIVLDRYFIPEDYDSLEDGLANQLKSSNSFGYKGKIFLWTNGAMKYEEAVEKGFDDFLTKGTLILDKIG
ncbi:MAG: hypothetical protein AB8G05_24175 [Oligoflexales bacterium]